WAHREWGTYDLLDRARASTARGKHSAAGPLYAMVLAWWPRHDESAFGFGVGEEAAGRADAAVRVWRRIDADSPYAILAAARIAPIILERGRFAEAEVLLRRALGAGGATAARARELLGRVLRFEDRRDEARDLLREELSIAPDPIRVLRALWMLDAEAMA